jgi:signal transduction histidine kinase
MKIAQKLGLLVGSLLVAMLATIVLLSALIRTTSGEYDRLIHNQLEQSAAARTMQIEFGKQVQDFQHVLLRANNATVYAQLKEEYDAQNVLVDKLTDQLLANVDVVDPRLRTSLTEFKSTHAGVNAQYQAAMNAFVASNYQAITAASSAVQGQEAFPNDLVSYIVSYRQQSVDQLIAAQQDTVDLRLNIIYGAGALVLLLAAIAVTLVVRGIVKPVRSLTAAALDAANNRLPRVVAEIATLPDDAPTPSLPKFEVTTRDELSTLASALTSLQDSAVELALDQRRNEKANSETLVNLGRRNQSLLTRMLSYVTELEHDERDAKVLDKLFRLDHLTTRIRRNAESLLVLAGAKQTRTWSKPIAIADVLQAALSEIEEYTRVTIHHVDTARVHGGVAADLTHMLAELLENATRFSPRERQVLVVGRLTPSGYQFDLIDAGLGMSEEELEAANSRISEAGQKRPDTKVLGHHVVGRIAARRGIFVRLLPSVQTGITAQVLVPAALLSDTGAPTAVAAPPLDGAISDAGSGDPDSNSTATDTTPIPLAQIGSTPATANPAPANPAPASPAPASPVPANPAASNPAPATAPAAPASAPAAPQLPTPRPQPLPDRVSASVQSPAQPAPAQPGAALPGRRIRGAQLDSLAEPEPEPTRAPRDPAAIRSQFSSLQSGIAAARRETAPQPNLQPMQYQPATPVGETPPAPARRVRGAQLAELGADSDLDGDVPVRDAAAIGRQLSGLQAATNRARYEAGQQTDTDETFGSNA